MVRKGFKYIGSIDVLNGGYKKVIKRLMYFFFSVWIFFQAHSQFTGQQGKGEAIYLTPLYHFNPLHRYLDISRVFLLVFL